MWMVSLLVCGPGCDEDTDPDDTSQSAGVDVPGAVDGCPDGDALVEIGNTRDCECDDGTLAEQTCLASGEYADCKCGGGGW